MVTIKVVQRGPHFPLSRDLQEGAVLQNLKKRFEREIIYVSIKATMLSLLMKKNLY